MAEDINFDDELTRAINADPFVPFTIVMTSGERYEVTNPMLIAYGGDGIVLLRPRVGSAYLRIYNVASIDVHETSR